MIDWLSGGEWISALTRVSFERNFIRFLSEIHGMSQNKQNSTRKTKMNGMKQFNRIVNPLTLTVVLGDR